MKAHDTRAFDLQFCPSCASKNAFLAENRKVSCPDCGFLLYHNTAAAVAVLIRHPEGYIIQRRAMEPGLGLLDLPGGFVDLGESAEEACIREVREEMSVEIRELKYRASGANLYRYGGVNYNTCDLFFTAYCDAVDFSLQKNEVKELLLLEASQIPLEDFAFSSIRSFLEDFFGGLKPEGASCLF